MNIFDRFILGLYAFIIAIFSTILVLIGSSVIEYSTLTYYAQLIVNQREYMIILTIVASVFLLISIRFLLSGTQKSKLSRAIKKESEFGDIMISLNSIQNIVFNVLKEIDGVMEQKIVVTNHKDSVKLKLKVVVTPEMSIPELSKRIQSTVKDIIENIVGAQVKAIEVYVDNVVQPIKPKFKDKNQIHTEQ